MTELGNQSANPQLTERWERELVREIATAALVEQRRSRRWGIFFKFLIFAYLFIVLALFLREGMDTTNISGGGGKHTALIEIKGIIMAEEISSADNIVSALRSAFENKNTAGIILRINSPGGSPVQSGYINNEIRRLKEKHPDIPVYAVVVDVCASGAYYIAVAADEIYVDKASMIGSIGVRMDSFGFTGAMEKVGVERRLLTAGQDKALLDPFSPLDPSHVAHMSTMLKQIHQQFIDVVKLGRGDRLQPNDAVFSGLVWNGEQSVEMGLSDGLASSSQVARDMIGVEKIVDYSPKDDLLMKLSKQLGVSISQTLLSTFTSAGEGLR